MSNLYTSTADVCPGQDLRLECVREEVIVMETATFGRMEQGKCIKENAFIGCTNNVLYLADRWCSGRRKCEANVPNDELVLANNQCETYLQKYLSVNYHCLKGKYINVSSALMVYTCKYCL
jgi:hypothetical protein